MDILLTDSLLKEFLETKATPEKVAECLSLCGPSIEKITKEDGETVYHIEVTTNRVDAASAKGIAQEALAILPQFGINAKLVKQTHSIQTSKKTFPVEIKIDKAICERFTAVLLTDIEVKESPQFMKSRLAAMEQRPLNNVIDITNYAMFALGVPMHAFDADKLGNRIIVREAKKGETFVTLDDAKHTAVGGEVVFDNGSGEIIDLPGIMGTKNSMVSSTTKNVLLVLEHMNHHKVRFASLKHERRTHAAILNEKNPDPNAIDEALTFAVSLLTKYSNATVGSEVFDWYPNPRKEREVHVSKKHIDTLLGISLSQKEITSILNCLRFQTKWQKDSVTVLVPSSRSEDVTIPEDVIEEIARIYGYFKLPSNLPTDKLPDGQRDSRFDFETKIKTLLSGWGGLEIYTLSFVSKAMAGENALKIKNPLGGDGEYMRTSLTPSLIEAANTNKHEKGAFHLFEISNVYLASRGKTKSAQLPREETRLAGVFANTDFRHAKGIIEALFSVLHITTLQPTVTKLNGLYLYEFDLSDLEEAHAEHTIYKPIPQFPPQVEDLTLNLDSIKVGDIMNSIRKVSSLVTDVQFLDSYENNYSFRISYQDPKKTLTDKEVREIREEILKKLKEEYGVTEK